MASVAAFLDVVRFPRHGHIDAPIGSLRKIALHAPAISFTMTPMGRSGSRRPMLTIVCPPYTLTRIEIRPPYTREKSRNAADFRNILRL